MPFVRLKQSPEGLWPAEGWKGTSRSASWREVPKPSKPSQKDVLWDTWYERFLKVEPNSRGQRIVAQGFVTPDGARLGTWQHAQRRAYRRGSLDAKRRQRLDEAGIVWDPYEAAWEQGFSCYEDFPAELLSGKRIVSSAYITPGGYRLGKWQENQRQARRRGELSATRIARLEAAGIVWSAQDAAWWGAFERFRNFPADANGDRLVPQHYATDDGFKLGHWQHVQRQMWRSGKLNDERAAQLESVGMVWQSTEALWHIGLKRFAEFSPDADGRRNVPRNFVCEDGYKLGSWQASQRMAHKRGTLSTERSARLQELGIVWYPRQEAGKSRGGNSGRGKKQGVKSQTAGGGQSSAAATGRGKQVNAQCEPRRRLSSMLQASSEAVWYEEWRRRLGCWMLALPGPTRFDLVGCLGALTLHLGSRLDLVFLDELVGNPGARPNLEEDPHCKWVETTGERLELPRFPTHEQFDFSLPPIPRLLPTSEQLLRLSSHGAHWRTGVLAFGHGAAAFALAAAVLIPQHWRHRRRPLRVLSTRPSLLP